MIESIAEISISTNLKSLHDLPNELLLLIVEHIGEQHHLPRKFRVIYALSQVNRRLRDFCIPHLYRHLCFTSSKAYARASPLFSDWGPLYNRAVHVRSVCIGNGDILPIAKSPVKLHARIPCPFSNLHSFECSSRIPERDIMNNLAMSPHLKSLSLLWPDHWPFPDIHYTSKLETLRLNIVHRISCPPPGLSYCAVLKDRYPSLTTLQIVNCYPADWADGYWLTLTFPNLRVLSGQCLSARVRSVFDFVQRHPTLLEVNLKFDESYNIRLEAIIKLIEGTGIWRTPDDELTWRDDVGDPRRYYFTEEGKKKYLDEPERDFDGRQTFPDDIPDTRFTTDCFAFKRVPLTPEATKWNKRQDSSKPRYQCTALAIQIMDQGHLDFSEAPFGHFHDFFFLPDKFPAMEELRIMSQTTVPDDDFVSYMLFIGTRLKNWTKLRKLAVCFLMDEEMFKWGWSEPFSEPPAAAPGIMPFYDNVLPPSERWPTNGFLEDLELLRGDPTVDDPEKLDIIDDVLYRIEEDIPTVQGDMAYFMRIWQWRNEPRVTKVMRVIGNSCPSLDQLDWYPMGVSSDGNCVTQWKWKFLRKNCPHGQPYVARAIGDLTWGDSLRANFDPIMTCLVGQEWEHMKASSKRRY